MVTHGTMLYRSTFENCDPTDVPGATPTTYIGCQEEGGTVGQDSNYMTLYELDPVPGTLFSIDGHDLVETLYFPGTSVTLTGCNYYGCPEQTTDWVEMTSSTSPFAIIEADLRMTARAYLEGSCGWTPPPTNPVIDTFTATPATIYAGQSSTLEWETTDATSVSISGLPGTYAVDSSVSVSPTTTTTYRLTATGIGGATHTAVDVVTVTVEEAPLIDYFEAYPASIREGESTQLSWLTTDATSASIDQGVGSVTPVSGGLTSVLRPTETTTYTLTASDGDAATPDATASTTVTVTPPAHTVDSFTVDDTTPAIGDSVTFTWTTSHADSASLQKRFTSLWATTVRSLALNGTHSISRDSAGSESYRLSISQNYLDVHSSPITITWAASPPARHITCDNGNQRRENTLS